MNRIHALGIECGGKGGATCVSKNAKTPKNTQMLTLTMMPHITYDAMITFTFIP